MKIDIIGSKFTRKLTEFKNFRFELNNIVEGQSILSLLSEPYEATMKELNTTNLNEITVAHRDLNKLLCPRLKESDSDVIIIELLSELNDISELGNSYYNASSLALLDYTVESKILSNIEKFRAVQRYMDSLLYMLGQYEKVIFLKLLPKDHSDKDFIDGLYRLLEERIEHKLILNVDNQEFDNEMKAPLEFYSKVNDNLSKFSTDNYHNQLLFDEKLKKDVLSVYVNYVEEREYVYELYKNGKPFKSSAPTTDRYYEYQLDEPGKYRIRVNLTNEEIKPRFTLTYKFDPQCFFTTVNKKAKYIEMPSDKSLWMLDALLLTHDVAGLIGNAYEYPNGYSGYKVLLPEEVEEYIKREELFDWAISTISKMTELEFDEFISRSSHMKVVNPLIYKILTVVNRNPE